MPTTDDDPIRYDFNLTGSNGAYALTPLTARAVRWCHRYWPERSLDIGTSVTVDAAYIRGVVAGILDAGLTINP